MQDHIQAKLISIAKIATVTVATIAIIAGFILYRTSSNYSEQRIVAITQIVQHPSLDQIRQGILDELDQQGLNKSKKIKIVYENAHGNIATAVQIAQKFAGMNPEVIVGITTPSAQAIHSAIRGKDIPLVFSAVTDPISANLIKDLDRTAENVTGTIDLPPIKQQLALLKRLVPGLSKIGVIYNPGEVNSVKQIEKLETIARKEGIEIVKAPGVKSSEIFGAASRLVGVVGAFYLPNDNTVVAALDSIVRVANEHNIPILASDDQSTKHGVLVSLANNQYQVGRDTGKLVARILHGETADNIPAFVSNNPSIMFNEDAAKKLKIDVHSINLEDLSAAEAVPKKTIS
jgi:putative tryptophan/tyrosine transport system substrate-binding protein